MGQAYSIGLLNIWSYIAVLPGQQGRSGVSKEKKGEEEKQEIKKRKEYEEPGKNKQRAE